MNLPSITLWVSARDDCDNGLQCGDFIDEEIFQIVLQLSWKRLQNNVNQRLCDTFLYILMISTSRVSPGGLQSLEKHFSYILHFYLRL